MAKVGGAASPNGKPAVQVELRAPANEAGYDRVMVTWVSTEVKPKVGMVLTSPPDKTAWTVAKAYALVNYFEGLPSWR